ncbi:hypothetical protein [Cryobacterium sp. PH31-O1]|uniref:hypothetical protein n=1 Tax=Cryobacterium sp. PH31-O1 TaxID=3046306 RepID=UPI0024BA4172|nr:hypothetical protein [Cryobacterium sp. PH31-O1]MDJ0337481.1 hypothetical protein [Cryobacterium sp. PH31-O1]
MNPRKGIGPNIVSGLAVIGLLAAMIFLMVGTTERDAKIDRLSAGNDALFAQVQEQGQIPVAPPAETVTGDPGTDGGQGPRGFDGPPASAESILASVAGYCALRLDCAGPVGPVAPALIPRDGVDGTDGTNGMAGADSTVPGEKGDTGATGADSTIPGAIGLTGAGVASILCQDDGTWLFTLAQPDGSTTTQTVDGPCRVDPIIPTKETP